MAPRKATARRALRMRTAGAGYDRIAAELHMTADRAYEAVLVALRERGPEPPDVAARLQLERLAVMQSGLWKACARGDTKAIEQSMKIDERRAALQAMVTEASGGPSGTVGDYLDSVKSAAADEHAPAELYAIEGTGDQ